MGLCSDGDSDGSLEHLKKGNVIVLVKLEAESDMPGPCDSVYDRVCGRLSLISLVPCLQIVFIPYFIVPYNHRTDMLQHNHDMIISTVKKRSKI